MSRRQKVILAVLGVLLVIVWARALFPKRSTRSTGSIPRPRAVAVPVVASPPMDEVAEQWGDSPFLTDRGSKKGSEAAAAGSPGGSYILNGILWDPKTPSAIINNRLVSRGDHLAEWEVTEIQKDHVILSDGSETKILRASN